VSILACTGTASAQRDDVSLSDDNVARLGSFGSRPGGLPPESEHVLSLSLRGGAMATDDQRQVLTFNREGAAATLTGGLRPLPWIAGELSLGGLVVGSTDEAAGGLLHASLGLRLMPRLDRFTPFGRVSFGVGLTGLIVAPVFEGGVGFWIDLADEWSAGPEVAVTHVVWEDGPMRTSDAVFVSGGVVLAFRPRPTPSPPPGERERLVVRDRVRVETRLLRVPPPPPSDPETLMRLVDRAVPATVTRSVDSLVPPLLFDHDDTELSSCGEASLYDLLRAIDEAPPDTHLVVEGHADGSGEDAYNRALSTRRAEAVRRFLVEHGVAADRIEIRAHGEGAPLVDETDDRAQSLNRRVVIHFERTTSSMPESSVPQASTSTEPTPDPIEVAP
jgi:outer membrane protein OmpA-like peptidoglycan-associated protein